MSTAVAVQEHEPTSPGSPTQPSTKIEHGMIARIVSNVAGKLKVEYMHVTGAFNHEPTLMGKDNEPFLSGFVFHNADPRHVAVNSGAATKTLTPVPHISTGKTGDSGPFWVDLLPHAGEGVSLEAITPLNPESQRKLDDAELHRKKQAQAGLGPVPEPSIHDEAGTGPQ